MNKTLDNLSVDDIKGKGSPVSFVGNGDTFQLICKAWNNDEGWMKSTKAMEIPRVGCVIQVTTQNYGNVSEALVFVPNVKIGTDENGNKAIVAAF